MTGFWGLGDMIVDGKLWKYANSVCSTSVVLDILF